MSIIHPGTTQIDALDEHLTLMEIRLLYAEEEIRRRLVFLSNMRTQRNSFLPVSRLPPETLAAIFIHSARDHYESDSGGHLTPCVPVWVNVSYVCSHWRNVALDCPTLWSYHFNVSLRWTEELLLRSKEAPLKISYCTPYRQVGEGASWWPRLWDSLLKHSERIQELRLDVWPLFLPTMLSLRVPHLEKLEIYLRPGTPEHFITIIDGDKLSLCSLTLFDCPLPWYLFKLSGLKELVLMDTFSFSPPNVVEFLSILSGMQSLTLLHLDDALPSARGFLTSGGLDDSPKSNLPHLVLLAVSAPLSTIVALLSSVKIPPRTQIRLRPLFERGSSVDDFAPICSFLAQQFESSGPILCSLTLYADSGMTLSSSPDCRRCSQFGELNYDIPLDVTLGSVKDDGGEVELTQSNSHRIIGNICCSLPLTNVLSLHVIYSHRLSSNFWSEMLGYLDALVVMKLSCGWMPDLSMLSLAAHGPDKNFDGQPTQDSTSTSNRILIPALEAIELDDITFMRKEDGMSQTSFFDMLSTCKRYLQLTMTDCGLVHSNGQL